MEPLFHSVGRTPFAVGVDPSLGLGPSARIIRHLRDKGTRLLKCTDPQPVRDTLGHAKNAYDLYPAASYYASGSSAEIFANQQVKEVFVPSKRNSGCNNLKWFARHRHGWNRDFGDSPANSMLTRQSELACETQTPVSQPFLVAVPRRWPTSSNGFQKNGNESCLCKSQAGWGSRA